MFGSTMLASKLTVLWNLRALGSGSRGCVFQSYTSEHTAQEKNIPNSIRHRNFSKMDFDGGMDHQDLFSIAQACRFKRGLI